MSFTAEKWTAADEERLLVYMRSIADAKYKAFNDRIMASPRPSIGVRTPACRAVRREISKGDWRGFSQAGSDGEPYELFAMRACAVAAAKCGIEEKLERIAAFIPLLDSWGLCDGTSTEWKDAEKHKAAVWEFLLPYAASEREFERRFSYVMMLDHFIDDEYIDRILRFYFDDRSELYYVRMAVAWGISFCYIKYPDRTLPYIKSSELAPWTHNKAIQKIIESYRVSDGDKAMLRGLKKSK